MGFNNTNVQRLLNEGLLNLRVMGSTALSTALWRMSRVDEILDDPSLIGWLQMLSFPQHPLHSRPSCDARLHNVSIARADR